MVGLPGTGLGGIFYGLLVLWMIVRESWMSLVGAGDRRRWRAVASLSAMLGAILLVFWAEGWLIKAILDDLPANIADGVAQTERRAAHALVPALAVTPVVILALLMAAVQIARLIVPRRAAGRLSAPEGLVGADRTPIEMSGDVPDRDEEDVLQAAE